MVRQLAMAALFAGLACGVYPGAGAETVYKCVTGGRTNFTAAPKAGQNCNPVELKVVKPDPEEVERELEQKRMREKKEKEDERESQMQKLPTRLPPH